MSSLERTVPRKIWSMMDAVTSAAASIPDPYENVRRIVAEINARQARQIEQIRSSIIESQQRIVAAHQAQMQARVQEMAQRSIAAMKLPVIPSPAIIDQIARANANVAAARLRMQSQVTLEMRAAEFANKWQDVIDRAIAHPAPELTGGIADVVTTAVELSEGADLDELVKLEFKESDIGLVLTIYSFLYVVLGASEPVTGLGVGLLTLAVYLSLVLIRYERSTKG